MRALLGSTVPNQHVSMSHNLGGCCCASRPNNICNSPHTATDAAQLCRDLGYRSGTVFTGNGNRCPEVSYGSDRWSSDFVQSPHYGKWFRCSRPLGPAPKQQAKCAQLVKTYTV